MAAKKTSTTKSAAEKVIKAVKRGASALAGKEDWITIRPKKKKTKSTKKGPT